MLHLEIHVYWTTQLTPVSLKGQPCMYVHTNRYRDAYLPSLKEIHIIKFM